MNGGTNMIVPKDFLAKLKDFGLNSYEAKIWTALLSRGVASAGELSDISNVPRSRSYDVLESLEKKGFIIMKVGKPIKYIAVSPIEVVERVKKRVSEDTDKTLKVMDELKGSDVLDDLTKLHENGIDTVEATDLTASLKGQNNIYEHLNLMLKEAEKEVIIVTSETGVLRKSDALLRSIKKAHERGVSIKIAAPFTKGNEDTVKLLGQYAEMRDAINNNARFAIADGAQVLFMLTNDTETHPSYDVAVWVNTTLFAQTLNDLFKLAWNTMKILN